jgi:predicted PurR-regulated permease PerM
MNDTPASARIIKREAQGIAAPALSGRTVAFAFAAALTLVALWMARNFLLPITWAIILVITTWPFYCRFVQYMPRHRAVLPPLAFTLLIALLLILPLGFVTFDVAREVVSAAAWVAHAQQDGIPPPDWVARLPLMGDRAVTWWHAHLSEPHAAGHLLDLLDPGVVANWAGIFGAQLVQITVFLVVTLLAVFLLLHNGERLGHLARLLVDRLRGDVSECFADRLTAAVGAVVTGTVLVALGESALIGAGYVVAGVPRPALFATLTAVCAMLPLGSWVVFAAAALLLFAQGRAG